MRKRDSSLVAPETRNLGKPRVENHFKHPTILSFFLIQKMMERERGRGNEGLRGDEKKDGEKREEDGERKERGRCREKRVFLHLAVSCVLIKSTFFVF